MKKTIYVLALGTFGIVTTEFGVIGILPQLASEFHIGIDKAGWLLSAFALTVAVFGPVFVLLLQGFNKKKILCFALAIFIFSNLLSVVATSFNMLLFARILPAFFHPVYWSIALTTAVKLVPEDQSSKAVGLVFGGLTIASVLGVPLATFIAGLYTWKASFILSAFVNAVSLAGVLIFLPDIKATVNSKENSPIIILKKPLLWINLLLACLIISAMFSTYGYIADFLHQTTGMDGKQISIMLFIFGTMGIAGNWLTAVCLVKNVFNTTFLFIIILIVVHLLLYFFSGNFLAVAMVVAFWGLVHTGGFIIGNFQVTSSAKEAPELANSIFTSCGNLAVTIGSAAGGFSIAHFGIHKVVCSSIILLIFALIVLLYRNRFFKDRI